MSERPGLSRALDAETFRGYYYLKAELLAFCRENQLPTSGGKQALTERIARFLDTGEVSGATSCRRTSAPTGALTEQTVIEPDMVCSQAHRAFFEERIGKGFSFCVPFQKWLRANAGKTYGDAVQAYFQILEEKKTRKSTIDSQFAYNTYIRDFFADNPGRSLAEAIACWRFKKGQRGAHRYERADLSALETPDG